MKMENIFIQLQLQLQLQQRPYDGKSTLLTSADRIRTYEYAYK